MYVAMEDAPIGAVQAGVDYMNDELDKDSPFTVEEIDGELQVEWYEGSLDPTLTEERGVLEIGANSEGPELKSTGGPPDTFKSELERRERD